MADTEESLRLLLEARDNTSEAFRALREHLDGLREGVSRVKEIAIGEIVGELATRGIETALEKIKEFGAGMIAINASSEQLHQTLTSLYESGAKADQAFAYMTKFALTAPFTKQSIMEAGVAIASFGGDITQVLPALGNVAAVMGVSMPVAAQALTDAVEGRFAMMQRDLHVSKDELVKYGLVLNAQGQVMNNTLLPAFERFAQVRFPTGMSNQMQTFTGQMSNLEDQFQNFERIAGGPLFAGIKAQLIGLITWLNNNQTEVQNFAYTLGTVLGAGARLAFDAIHRLVGVLGPAAIVVANLAGMLAGPVGSAFDLVREKISGFATWFASSVAPIIGATITRLVGWWREHGDQVVSALQRATSIVASAFGLIADNIGRFANWFGQTAIPLIGQALEGLVGFWQDHAASIGTVLSLIGDNVSSFKDYVARQMGNLFDVLQGVVTLGWGAVQLLFGGAIDILSGNWTQLQKDFDEGGNNLVIGFTEIFAGLIKYAGTWAVEIASWAIQALIPVVNNLLAPISWFAQHFRTAFDGLGLIIGLLVGALDNAWVRLENGVSLAADAIATGIQTLVNDIADGINWLTDKISNGVQAGFQVMVDGVTSAANLIIKAIDGIMGKMSGLATLPFAPDWLKNLANFHIPELTSTKVDLGGGTHLGHVAIPGANEYGAQMDPDAIASATVAAFSTWWGANAPGLDPTQTYKATQTVEQAQAAVRATAEAIIRPYLEDLNRTEANIIAQYRKPPPPADARGEASGGKEPADMSAFDFAAWWRKLTTGGFTLKTAPTGNDKQPKPGDLLVPGFNTGDPKAAQKLLDDGVTTAKQQLALDLRTGATMATLLADVKALAMAQLAAHVASKQVAITTGDNLQKVATELRTSALQDKATGASQDTLLQDIANYQKVLTMAGDSPKQVNALVEALKKALIDPRAAARSALSDARATLKVDVQDGATYKQLLSDANVAIKDLKLTGEKGATLQADTIAIWSQVASAIKGRFQTDVANNAPAAQLASDVAAYADVLRRMGKSSEEISAAIKPLNATILKLSAGTAYTAAQETFKVDLSSDASVKKLMGDIATLATLDKARGTSAQQVTLDAQSDWGTLGQYVRQQLTTLEQAGHSTSDLVHEAMLANAISQASGASIDAMHAQLDSDLKQIISTQEQRLSNDIEMGASVPTRLHDVAEILRAMQASGYSRTALTQKQTELLTQAFAPQVAGLRTKLDTGLTSGASVTDLIAIAKQIASFSARAGGVTAGDQELKSTLQTLISGESTRFSNDLAQGTTLDTRLHDVADILRVMQEDGFSRTAIAQKQTELLTQAFAPETAGLRRRLETGVTTGASATELIGVIKQLAGFATRAGGTTEGDIELHGDLQSLLSTEESRLASDIERGASRDVLLHDIAEIERVAQANGYTHVGLAALHTKLLTQISGNTAESKQARATSAGVDWSSKTKDDQTQLQIAQALGKSPETIASLFAQYQSDQRASLASQHLSGIALKASLDDLTLQQITFQKQQEQQATQEAQQGAKTSEQHLQDLITLDNLRSDAAGAKADTAKLIAFLQGGGGAAEGLDATQIAIKIAQLQQGTAQAQQANVTPVALLRATGQVGDALAGAGSFMQSVVSLSRTSTGNESTFLIIRRLEEQNRQLELEVALLSRNNQQGLDLIQQVRSVNGTLQSMRQGGATLPPAPTTTGRITSGRL